VGADPTKPKAVKAKQLRLQKKLKSEMAESSSSAQSESSSAHQSREKGLADLLEEYDSAVAKHKFEVTCVLTYLAEGDVLTHLAEGDVLTHLAEGDVLTHLAEVDVLTHLAVEHSSNISIAVDCES